MRRNRILILPLFSLLIVFAYFYIGFRLGAEESGWIFLLIPFLLIFIPIFFMWRRTGREHNRFEKILFQGTYASMATLSYLFVFTLIRDLILGILSLVHVEVPEGILSPNCVFAATLLAILIGTWKATSGPSLKKVNVPIENIPPELDGLRIVQISDLHVSSSIGKKYVRKVVNLANKQSADLVALTGDVVDGYVDSLRGSVAGLKDLKSDLGVFYVPGNHEYYWGAQAWFKEIQSLGFTVLLNDSRNLKTKGVEIAIAGVVDPMDPQGPNVKKAAAGISSKALLKILLNHRPEGVEEAAQLGFSLQLSGHTHGGQFFPWTLVTPLVHKFNAGLARVQSMWIYVSVGTGSWGPQVRLGTTCEVTLLVISKK